MKVLVTGINGQLGNDVVIHCAAYIDVDNGEDEKIMLCSECYRDKTYR